MYPTKCQNIFLRLGKQLLAYHHKYETDEIYEQLFSNCQKQNFFLSILLCCHSYLKNSHLIAPAMGILSCYSGKHFNSSTVPPTIEQINQSFGSTTPCSPIFDENKQRYVMNFRGLAFFFTAGKLETFAYIHSGFHVAIHRWKVFLMLPPRHDKRPKLYYFKCGCYSYIAWFP